MKRTFKKTILRLFVVCIYFIVFYLIRYIKNIFYIPPKGRKSVGPPHGSPAPLTGPLRGRAGDP
jgi:NADH:ubiquinone oxidoreductase subunit 5 (subunit L)/multisubunit Na+/H+ antiporter MnhA subunit